MSDQNIIQQQIDYYRARALEYDEWFYRLGRYDQGEAKNRLWFEEAATVIQSLHHIPHAKHTLELAAGTGIWTRELLRISDHITAVDAVAETLELNHDKLYASNITYVEADIFNWQPTRAYDLVFFAFWLSHVPPDRLASFLKLVYDALKPGGYVFFVDSRRDPSSTAKDHVLPDDDSTTLKRRLNNGQEFQIIKIFYEPADLQSHFEQAGLTMNVSITDHYFIYGQGQRPPEAS